MSKTQRTEAMPARLLFVTGTDTGVGKTLLTGSLVTHLLAAGKRAIALKPFCSGSTDDIDFLWAVQGRALTRQDLNPYYFPEPVAPLVSARMHRQRLRLPDVVKRIQETGADKEYILIEGSGGLLVPLGPGFDVRDLILALGSEVIVVSQNRLGTLNHTLLTLEALRARGCKTVRIALMQQQNGDFSARSNLKILRQLCAPISVISVPYIVNAALDPRRCARFAKKLKKTLASILA